MTKITIETETIETDLPPAEAAAKVREALGVREFPKIGDVYWYVDDRGDDDVWSTWSNYREDHYRLAHGNCSPTREGLAQYKADMAKLAAIVAIRKHRDKTFGVFEPRESEARVYGRYAYGVGSRRELHAEFRTRALADITVPFRTSADIQCSFVECAEHWEVLK